jgi:hypothetical protein
MDEDKALKLALEALENELAVDMTNLDEVDKAAEKMVEAIWAINKALAAPVQEPVVWKWHQAPVKTSWGHEMVVADLAIDKDNTVSVYCERDQTAKAEAMFTPPAAQRQRVVFPTMLRKMWSGGEVQAWLDETVNKENNT